MVEIEIGVLRGQCLDRRIGERETLLAEVNAWQRQRNDAGAVEIHHPGRPQQARPRLSENHQHVVISVQRY
jgi:hypothetical protein